MKKDFSVFLIATIISANTYAQYIKENAVPLVVKEAFKRQYPGVNGKWEKEKDNYEVNFKKDKTVMSAVFDATGKMVETETEIAVKDLPTSVTAYVKANYKGAVIHEAARIKKPGGEILYEAAVNKKDLLFGADGKFIKEEKD